MMNVLVTLPMNMDTPPVLPPVHVGDMVWAFDTDSGMKIPLKVMKVYEDGSWDGRPAWTWGLA